MEKKLFLFFAFVFLFASTGFAQWISLDNISKPGSVPIVTLLKDDASETIIKVDLPGFSINEFKDGDVIYNSINIGDAAGKLFEAGVPDIPYIAKVLAVPDQGTLSVEVIGTGNSRIIPGINIPPVRKSWSEGKPETPYIINDQVYKSVNYFPSLQSNIENPMIFRDFRISRVSIFPLIYSPAKKELEAFSSVTVRIKYGDGIGINPRLSPDKPIAPSFARLYKSIIFNYKDVLEREYNGREEGYDFMLCIMPDSFVTTFEQYADWNNKTGTFIHITKFSEIGASGSNPTAVKNHILDAYTNWPVPPTHVLLVGDAGVAPVKYITLDGWTFTYDDYFVELTGIDYMPEMFIGRFTNQGNFRLNIMENKFIGYEKDPFIDDPNWFRKGAVCSNNQYYSQILTKKYTKQEMLLHGNFLSVDSLFNGYPCPGNTSTVVNMINQGRGWLNYRGEGWYSGWGASCFPLSTSDINSLNNGRKLTFVTSIGCGVANFDNGSNNNFGEAWMEIGDADAPRGGCAFIGPVSNTHTDYNNEIDKGIYSGMFELGMDSPGEALLNGKFVMYEVYGGADAYVPYHFRIYHILGDPSLHIWKDTPKNINVVYTDTISLSVGQISAAVTYAGSGLPVDGAMICVSGDDIYSVGFTQADGTAIIDINPQVTGELNFTVSGKDVIPFEGTVYVGEGGAGQGWQWIETGYAYTIYDISFPPGQSDIGYAVGSNVSNNGIILKTTDGGSSWTKISDDGITGLRSVCFTSAATGFVGGYQNTLLKTTDGGLTWGSKSSGQRAIYISSIKFQDSNNGLFVTYPVTMMITTNGGDNWYFAQNIKQNVEDLCFADANNVYMVGNDEMVSKSTNGGQWWEHIYSGIPLSKLVGVDFYNADYGIAGGENGKIIVTNNGGVNWTPGSGAGSGLMRGIYILDSGNAFAAGSPEQVYKSVDGGYTWVSDFNGSNTVEFYKLVFTENHTAIICGSDGKFLINHDYVIPVELTGFTAAAEGNDVILNWSTATETNNSGFEILRSTDGNNWERMGFVQGAGTKSTATNYTYKDLHLNSGSYLYKLKQIDYDGKWKYSDKVETEVFAPEKFSLEQNYPNPFNPVTTIRITIAREVMVNLTIYNIVGEKVKELKNEIMKPGYYQVDFDAAGIASGVYFYRLQAGEFMSTKKMNLLK